MPQKNAQDRLWKILTPMLLVLTVLAMAKTLFVGLEIDEEYAFSLGFRLVKGDRLFYTMGAAPAFGLTGSAGAGAVYRHCRHNHRGAAVCARCGAGLQSGHERGILPRIQADPWPPWGAAGRGGAVCLHPQVVPGAGLYQPAVPLHRGGIFVLFTIITPMVSAAHGW